MTGVGDEASRALAMWTNPPSPAGEPALGAAVVAPPAGPATVREAAGELLEQLVSLNTTLDEAAKRAYMYARANAPFGAWTTVGRALQPLRDAWADGMRVESLVAAAARTGRVPGSGTLEMATREFTTQVKIAVAMSRHPRSGTSVFSGDLGERIDNMDWAGQLLELGAAYVDLVARPADNRADVDTELAARSSWAVAPSTRRVDRTLADIAMMGESLAELLDRSARVVHDVRERLASFVKGHESPYRDKKFESTVIRIYAGVYSVGTSELIRRKFNLDRSRHALPMLLECVGAAELACLELRNVTAATVAAAGAPEVPLAFAVLARAREPAEQVGRWCDEHRQLAGRSVEAVREAARHEGRWLEWGPPMSTAIENLTVTAAAATELSGQAAILGSSVTSAVDDLQALMT